MPKKTTVKTRNLKKGNPTKPFSAKNQPSSKSKKEGRERKREAQSMLDDIMRKESMKYSDFLKKFFDETIKYKSVKEVQKDGSKKDVVEEVIKYEPKPSLTIRERYIALYVYDAISKGSPDWMNRHISYAPQKTELTGEDGGPIDIINPDQEKKINDALNNNM